VGVCGAGLTKGDPPRGPTWNASEPEVKGAHTNSKHEAPEPAIAHGRCGRFLALQARRGVVGRGAGAALKADRAVPGRGPQLLCGPEE